MNAKKKRRLAFAAALVAVGAVLALIVVYGLGQNTMYFRSPSDVAAKQVAEGVSFRLGGLVQKGSIAHGADAEVNFAITDGNSVVPVRFRGVLPALFREGQGVVTTGALNAGGTFVANEVLAKHDEKYMPPEVVESLKRSGRWKEGEAQ
jgi:cytochrome c-type biogenesis protein CcmE